MFKISVFKFLPTRNFVLLNRNQNKCKVLAISVKLPSVFTSELPAVFTFELSSVLVDMFVDFDSVTSGTKVTVIVVNSIPIHICLVTIQIRLTNNVGTDY